MTAFARNLAISIAAPALFLLTACGSANDGDEADGESVEGSAVNVMQSDIRPTPGRWESSVKIAKIDMPGMPAAMQEQMKQHMSVTQTYVSCLTPEEAEKPDADFFQPGQSGCKYSKFDMGAGKVAAEMTCEHDGVSQQMQMTGTYSEESYSMDISTDGEFAPGQRMSMTMNVSSHRVGDCTGEEQK